MSQLHRSTTRLCPSASHIHRTFSTTRLLREASKDNPKVSANYNRPPVTKSRLTGSKLPVFPLIAIFVLGTVSFYQLAKSRDGQGASHYVLPARANRDEIYTKKP